MHTRAGLVRIASAISGIIRCGSTEVYQEPGPTMIQSAFCSASITSCATRGRSGISRTCSTRPSAVATCHCPETVRTWSSTPRTRASMSSGSSAIGSTRPRAPSSSAIWSSPSIGSSRICHSATIRRLPRAWPSSSPSVEKRCWMTSPQMDPQSESSHRAASAIRRSPGGSTGISVRIRPEEPPLSATVTTAVMSSASRRRARRFAASPCPPPRATTRSGRWGSLRRPRRALAERSAPRRRWPPVRGAMLIPAPDRGGGSARHALLGAAPRRSSRRPRHCDACRPCSRWRAS